MARFLDISMRIVDPLDEYRLFDPERDGDAIRALLARVVPTGGVCALSAPTYYRLGEGTADLRRLNALVLEEQRSCRQAMAAFGVAEPRYLVEGLAELEWLARNGAKGVVWSCRAQGVFADDALMEAACRRAHELGLVSLFRTVPYSTNEALWRIHRLARRCSHIPLVISAALQSWDNAQMLASGGSEAANVFYDTAGWSKSTGLAALVERLGDERVLFGTAGLEPCDEAAIRLEAALVEAGLAADRIFRLMHGNASRLLALAETGL